MSERLEREIEEILRRLDSTSPRRSFSARLKRAVRRWNLGIRRSLSWLRITPTSVMVVSLVLFGLSIFLRAVLRQLAFYIALLAVILFFVAIFMSARQGGRITYERRWRGQLVEFPEDKPWVALREWWQRQWRNLRRWFDSK